MKMSVKLKDYLKAVGLDEKNVKKNDDEYRKQFEEALKNAVEKNSKNLSGKKQELPKKDISETTRVSEVISRKDKDTAEKPKNEQKTKLEKELEDMRADYESKKTHTFGGVTVKDFEPKEFVGKSDEEIKAQAEEKYNPSAERERKELVRKSGKSANKLEELLPSVDEEKYEKLQNLKRTLENDYESVKNSAVKRGLGRSSVLSGEIDALAKDYYSDVGETEQNASDKKQEIADKIADINDELYYAIKNLDEKTAEKIKNEIDSLTNAREKERKKVDEYNETQRAKYEEQLKNIEQNGVKYDEKLTDEYASYYSDKFRKLLSYYKSFGDSAAEELKKDKQFVVNNLDEKGYDNLLKYL